jgi:hypothetical protein
MILCPRVTDIVYDPPPSNFNLGADKWLIYLWPAMSNAVSARRLVFETPMGVCTHSGRITRLVSPESRVMMP